MNNIIELKASFNSTKQENAVGPSFIPENESVTSFKVQELLTALLEIQEFWNNDTTGLPPILSLVYYRIIPKTLRMCAILKEDSNNIIGTKIEGVDKKNYIITYKTSLEEIQTGIKKLQLLVKILESKPFSGSITGEQLAIINSKNYIKAKNMNAYSQIEWKELRNTIASSGFNIAPFSALIQDCYNIKNFCILQSKESIEESEIITLFDLGLTIPQLYQRLNLDLKGISYTKTSLLLDKANYAQLHSKAPYLISMAVTNLKNYQPIEKRFPLKSTISPTIPEPIGTEPLVGVIDTLFDKENAYFSSWVDYTQMLDLEEESIEAEDYSHGTEVSSIIVEGPTLNPALEDGCGRFRVKHFGVALSKKTSSYTLMRKIDEIIRANPLIKVWNLSLGAPNEINQNFISPEAALLDEIQAKHDVIFIIAGTNNNKRDHSFPRLGSPADSINSIVVNSTDFANNPPCYARKGPVLDFFTKPDISCFGGDRDELITAYSNKGFTKVQGTSFAAPWITRKVAFLIHKLGFTREEAKAILIDSAAGWNVDFSNMDLLGFGVVPCDIRKIVASQNDEIRFIIKGTSKEYETYSYEIPIPIADNKFPYYAKATLCYTSECQRNCGVDYTCNELDIHFGRINKEGKIKAINNNIQGDDIYTGEFEADARRIYRKWDTVKYLTEGFSTRGKGKIIYNSQYWGLLIRQKNRFNEKPKDGINFTVIVTLKEINGKNRINEFIKLCHGNSYFFDEIDIDQRINVFEKAEAIISFDDK